MWWTSEGERVLRKGEWQLFREGLAGLWGYIEDAMKHEPLFHSGVAAFDDLQPEQQLALLALVGKALRDETTDVPELTAHTEATVAAIFEYVRQAVELEIDGPGEAQTPESSYWRLLVLAACRDVDEEWDEPLPDVSCTDSGEWGLLIDVLAERILWDYDFDLQESFLDGKPEVMHERMDQMGMARDYFLKGAPDPNDAELKSIRDTLREVTTQR